MLCSHRCKTMGPTKSSRRRIVGSSSPCYRQSDSAAVLILSVCHRCGLQVLKRELDAAKAPVLRALPAKKPAAPASNGQPLGLPPARFTNQTNEATIVFVAVSLADCERLQVRNGSRAIPLHRHHRQSARRIIGRQSGRSGAQHLWTRQRRRGAIPGRRGGTAADSKSGSRWQCASGRSSRRRPNGGMWTSCRRTTRSPSRCARQPRDRIRRRSSCSFPAAPAAG